MFYSYPPGGLYLQAKVADITFPYAWFVTRAEAAFRCVVMNMNESPGISDMLLILYPYIYYIMALHGVRA